MFNIKTRFNVRILSFLMSTMLTACGGGMPASSAFAPPVCVPDNTILGVWQVIFGGYGYGGCVAVMTVNGTRVLLEQTVATSAVAGSASLVAGPVMTAPFTFQGEFRTVQQNRIGAAGNPWEVAWIVWNYTDNLHFYSITPQPNGWVLNKEDPAYVGSQRFLATGSAPAYSVGSWHRFKVVYSVTNTMTVYIDNVLITSFQDAATPYPAGKLALYTELATTNFRNISVMNTDVPTAATPVTLLNF